MNLPNKLTVFRMILIVPFVILLLGGHAGWGVGISLFVKLFDRELGATITPFSRFRNDA